MLLKLRRELYGKKGIVLMDTALIAESKMSYLSNNNVILVTADKNIQEQRLNKRGYTIEQIKNRMNSQFSSKLKEQMIRDCINKDYYGNLWKFDNSEINSKQEIEKLFELVTQKLNVI